MLVAAYVFADSLPIPRSGPPGKASDPELIALAVAQATLGVPSDRQFLGLIGRLLPGWFPELPGQSQFNRRLRRLTPQIAAVQMMLAELVAEGRVRLVDGTLIGCANYPGCAERSAFAGARRPTAAAPPRAASSGGCGWSCSAIRGACRRRMTWSVPRPAKSVSARCVSPPAKPAPCSSPTAASGVGSTAPRWSAIDVELVTPDKHRLGERPPGEVAKARIRLVVESVFSTLKRQMRLETHLAKTPAGFLQRIAQRLLALTLGIYVNTLIGGRPGRSPPMTVGEPASGL